MGWWRIEPVGNPAGSERLPRDSRRTREDIRREGFGRRPEKPHTRGHVQSGARPELENRWKKEHSGTTFARLLTFGHDFHPFAFNVFVFNPRIAAVASQLSRIITGIPVQKRRIRCPGPDGRRQHRSGHQRNNFTKNKKNYKSQKCYQTWIGVCARWIGQANGNLESETVLLEQRLEQLKTLIDESRRHIHRAAQEMKLYVSGDKTNSAREQLQQSIAQCEKTNSTLKREHDQLERDIPLLQQQIQNWTIIEKYFHLFISQHFYYFVSIDYHYSV